MVTRKSQYAVQALFCLARNKGRGLDSVGIRGLAAEAGVPRKWLSSIFLELKGAGIIGSKRGKHGGYYLASSPDDITLSQIFEVTENGRSGSAKTSSVRESGQISSFGEIRELIEPILSRVSTARTQILNQTTLTHLLRGYRELHPD